MGRLGLYSVFPLLMLLLPSVMIGSGGSDPTPMPWPERFHALLYMNLTATGELMVTDIWYDWTQGRNVHLMQRQLDDLLYNVEWENGTSFYYTLGPTRYCHPRQWGIGLPRPGWLAGASYLGRRYTDGILCHVWTKLDFVWYYEDVDTRTPVRWDFFDGVTNYVMTFQPGAWLNDSRSFQAPSYCFGSDKDGSNSAQDVRGRNKSNPRALDMKVIFNLNFRRFI